MQKLLRGRWWTAGLLLAVGCRSEQAAFSFRPAPGAFPAPTAIPAPASAAGAALAATSVYTPSAANTAVSGTTNLPSLPLAPVAARLNVRRPQQPIAQFRQPVIARVTRAETAAHTTRTDTLHWVLGAALVVTGVVGGLLLGGWLGLGVGAALVLLGYYFVLKALGGRQAWLEVFQEFFNM